MRRVRVRNRRPSNLFELEALEPKVLLSADAAGVLAVTEALLEDPRAGVEEVSTTAREASILGLAGAPLEYSPGAEVDAIFGEDLPELLTAPGAVADSDSADSGEVPFEAVDLVGPAAAGEGASELEPVAEVVVGAQRSGAVEGASLSLSQSDPVEPGDVTGAVQSVASQLVQTLHAANAPPESALAGLLESPRVFSPGHSPGTMDLAANEIWSGGEEYIWEINDVDAGAGANPGWDLIRITGGLAINATSASKFNLQLTSLTAANAAGSVGDFNAASTYAWEILNTTTGITGFDRSAIQVSTAAFTNPVGTGVFVLDLSEDSKSLILRYLPSLPSVTFDQPTWAELGPYSLTGNGNTLVNPGNPAIGAIQVFAVHPGNPNIAWLGAVNGGLWQTTNLSWSTSNGRDDDGANGVDDAAEVPTWSPVADHLPSLAIGALAVSPFDASNAVVTSATPANQLVLYLGTGQFSSTYRGGSAAGLFRSRDGGASWTEVGNFDDLRITSIVPSTATAGFLYASTHEITPASGSNPARGGLYRSTDGGDNWVRISGASGASKLPEGNVWDVVQDPAQAARWYVALAGGFRRTDGSSLTAADKGIWKSENANAADPATVTWTKVVSGIVLPEDSNGSDDDSNGTTDEAGEGLKVATRIRLTASGSGAPSNPIYATVIGANNQPSGVFTTTNQGTAWTALSPTPTTNPTGQGGLHYAMAADPASSTSVFVAGAINATSPYLAIAFRRDGGSWTQITTTSGSGPNGFNTAPHGDTRNLVFIADEDGTGPSTSPSLILLSDGGIYRLRNPRSGGGTTWEFIGANLRVTEMNRSLVWDRQFNTVVAGTQDNGTIRQTATPNSWSTMMGGDGNYVGIDYSGGNSIRYFLANNFGVFYRLTYSAADTLVGGYTQLTLKNAAADATNFTGLETTAPYAGGLSDFALSSGSRFERIPFVVNAAAGNTLLMGRDRLYKSTDQGATVTRVTDVAVPAGSPRPAFVTALAYGGFEGATAKPGVIYVARGNNIYVSSNDGTSFQTATTTGTADVLTIALDPTDWRRAVAVDGSHVWLITVTTAADGSTSSVAVKDVTGNLTSLTKNFESAAVLTQGSQAAILAGTIDGAYRLGIWNLTEFLAAASPHTVWTRFGLGMPNVPVSSLVYEGTDDVLVAGTLGRGAWSISAAKAKVMADQVLRIETGSGNDDVRLRRATSTASQLERIEVLIGGSVVATQPLAHIREITVHTGAGNDTLTVDSSRRAVAVPDGIEFDGGDSALDTLRFEGLRLTPLLSGPAATPRLHYVDGQTVRAWNVETVTDAGTLPSFLSSLGTGLPTFSDWSTRLSDPLSLELPLLGRSLGSSLGGFRFTLPPGVGEEFVPGPEEEEGRTLGDLVEAPAALFRRLFESGTGLALEDLGTLITSEAELQSRLDSLDSTPGNVTVDGGAGRLVLGNVGASQPFRRTLSMSVPLDLDLLNGAIQLRGGLELTAEVELYLEVGVDAAGFYIRTDLVAGPEVVIRNLQVSGEVNAVGNFGLLGVTLDGATLTVDPDVKIQVDLQEPTPLFGAAADGKIRLYDLGAAADVGTMFAVTLAGDPTQSDLRLEGTFQVAAITPGGEPILDLGEIQLGLVWEQIDDLASLRIDTLGNPVAEILMRFLNLNGTSFLGELRRLLNLLSQMEDSSLLDVELPFGNGFKLSDAIDFSAGFLDQVYRELVDVCLTGSTAASATDIRQGRLTADATFNLVIDDVASDNISLTAAGTAANNSLADLAADLNAALPAALAGKVRAEVYRGNIRFCLLDGYSLKITASNTASDIFTKLGFRNNQGAIESLRFPSLQALFDELESLLDPDLSDDVGFDLELDYDQANKRLSFRIEFNYGFSESTSFAYDTDLGLGDLADFAASGDFAIAGTLTAGFTLGLDFQAIRTPILLGSMVVPPPSHGRLTSASTFQINLNDGERYTVTLPAGATGGFTSLSQLVAYLNTRIPATVTSVNSLPLNQVVRFVQASTLDSGGSSTPAVGIRLEVYNEDDDADGVQDAGEGDDNGNGTFDSLVGRVNSLAIEAAASDPIVTEVGFLTGDIARATIRGLYLEDASLQGNLTVTASNLEASARLAIFGIETSGGVATGSATVAFSLINPGGGTRIDLDELLLDLGNLGNYIGLSPTFNASLDLQLNNLAVTPAIFGSLLPAGAQLRFYIPDIRHVEYNAEPYDATTNPRGLFITYPELGPLFNFKCLGWTEFVIALDSLAEQLGEFKEFEFLDQPLPLINMSISQVLDFASDVAEAIQGLASGDGDTLDELEALIEDALGIPDENLEFSVDHTAVTLTAGTASTAAVATFNPRGTNNALRFTATGNGNTLAKVEFVDEGDYSAGQNDATAAYDASTKKLTINYNATYTTAATIRDRVNTLNGSNPSAMPFTSTLDTAAEGGSNDGSGTVQQTALKMELSYHLAYANTLPFQFSLADLVELLPADSPVRDLLGGVTDFVQASGSGTLDVTASADLRLVFGLDVSSPCHWQPFFYDTDYDGPNTGTGIELAAGIRGSNLNFSLGIGALTIDVKNGSATFDSDGLRDSPGGDADASFEVGLVNNNGDGRHYLRSGETFFDFDNINIDLTAGASAVLPLYALGGIPLGSSSDAGGDGYPDNDLVVFLPSLKRLVFNESTDSTVPHETVVAMPGASNDLKFTSPSAGLEVKFIELTSGSPSATLNGSVLEVRVTPAVTTASQVVALSFPSGWSAALSTATESGGTNTGSGRIYTAVTIITPDIAALFDDWSACDVIRNSGMLLDGLDALLGTIQDALSSQVLNRNLPLVGDKLADAADFIGDFRNGLLADLRNKLAEVGDPIGLVKEAIYNVLGEPGLNLIVKSDGSPITSDEDVEVECTGDELTFKIRLKKTLALLDTSDNPIDFDIGIPGLGLSVNGNVKIEIGFDLKLYFGINATDGFYFDTSDSEELRINFKITIPGLSATGELLFLQLEVSDDSDGVDAKGNTRNPSRFEGYFAVDLRDPVGSGNKLTFADMGSSGFDFEDFVDAELGAVAEVNLDFAVSFAGDARFPRLIGEFDLDWEWTLGGESDGELEFGFHNIQIDIGTFISQFIQPVLEEVKKVTEPFQPLVDALTAPIPILSDLAGEPITMLDLAEAFGYLDPGTREFIEAIAKIITLVNDTSFSNDGSVLIPIGDFNLQRNALGNVERRTGDPDPPAQNLSQGTSDTGTRNFLQQLEDLGFKFPFLEISELFKLFRGEPVSLIEYHMPVLDFRASFEQSIPVYPPLYVIFGGEIFAHIDLTFGYDTYGLQKFFSSEEKNPADIFDGFYVKDVNDQGEDVPEITLGGGVYAGAELNLGIAEAGVTGGVFLEVDFNLNDPDHDGKVRISELIANALQDLRCIFDIHGELYVELTAYLTIHLLIVDLEFEWDFARITILEFDITCPQPRLADYVDNAGNELESADSNGILRLNMGPYADEREVGDVSDGSETYTVTHISGDASAGEKVEVSFNGIKQTYEGVKKILADGGAGNDTIDLRSVVVPSESGKGVRGGAGNDTIYASKGGGKYYGDAGDDVIQGREAEDDFTGAVDIIYGGAGNDTLTGNEGDDEIYGEDGADKIYGNAGNDTLDGGGGNDQIWGDVGTDTIYGGDGADRLKGEDDNDWISGDGGDDTIEGGRGDDQLLGGDGDDWIDGGSGNDIVLGDSGTIVAPAFPGNFGFPVNVTGISGNGNDVIAGGPGDDALFGADGNDKLFGGTLLTSGKVKITEYDGQDFLDGGLGNDYLFADDAHGAESTTFAGATVGGFAWFDIADTTGFGNDVRDASEKGLAAVTVTLHRADTTVVGTTTTDADGEFTFTGLAAGDYYLVFTTPASMALVAQDAGSDDTADSDVDGAGQTATFTLDAGQADTSFGAGYYSTNAILSIDNPSIAEGNSGYTNLVFTVTLSNPSSQAVYVCYKTSPGTASRIYDYSTVEYTLVFQPGETLKTLSVPIVGDRIDEDDAETFAVTLSEPYGADLNPAHTVGIGTIIDDDNAPSLTAHDSVQIADPVTEVTPLSFRLELSNPSKHPLTFRYQTSQVVNSDGTLADDAAVVGVDYEATYELVPGTITFSPGETAKIVTIATLPDALDEYEEELALTVTRDPATPTQWASVGDGTATGRIADDDALPFVRISPTTQAVSEGHAGNKPVTLTLSLRNAANALIPSGRPVTVNWNTARGTALIFQTNGDPADVVYAFGTVTFAPGEMSKDIAVEIIGDTRIEPDEHFFVNLLAAGNGQLDVDEDNLNRGTVRIVDDESGDPGPWYVEFSKPVYTVSESAGVATITLVRAEGSSEPVAVYWSMGAPATPGIATPGVDYTGIWEGGASGPRGIVSFAADETVRTFDIPITPDDEYEGDELVFLSLANPTGGAVRGIFKTAVLVIADDDPAPTIAVSNSINPWDPDAKIGGVTEGAGITLDFRVTVTGKTNLPVQVDWDALNGTATASVDFVAAGGTLNFGSVNGTESQTISITIIDDAVIEETETAYVRLSNAQNGTITSYQGFGYIFDDDTIGVSGFVFMDLNGNGFYDESTEYPLSGVKVTVTDSAGDHSDTTDANGQYSVNVLLGEATVTVDETTLPSDSTITTGSNPFTFEVSTSATEIPDIGATVAATEDVPAESTGSGGGANNDMVYGGPGNDTLNGGGGDDWLVGGHWLGPGCACAGLSYDVTLLQQSEGDGGRMYVDPASLPDPGTLGGVVFVDTDADGVRDFLISSEFIIPLEPGLAGVQVNLFDSTWTLIATTWTDASGRYRFEKLTPCDYAVQFLPPAGYRFTTQDVGGNSADAIDSDADPITGLTAHTNISAGETETSIYAGLNTVPAGGPGPWSVQFGLLVYSVRETDGQATITLTQTPGSSEPVAVYYTLGTPSGGTATHGADYDGLWESGAAGARGIVSFGPGEDEKSFVIPVFEDNVSETYETVFLRLKNPTGGEVTGNLPEATLLIFDNPCPDDDVVYGLDGADVLLGDFGYFDAGAPELLGGMGNDALYGGDGADQLYGEGGNDILEGGTDEDALDGGSENDTYVFDGDLNLGSDTIAEVVSPFGGTDTIDLSATSGWAITFDLSSVAAQAVTPSLTLTLPAGNVIENVRGGSRDDVLTGNDLDNVIDSGAGADVIEGRNGNDVLIGGSGNDTYLYQADALTGHHEIVEDANADTDLIDFSGTTVNVTLDLSSVVSQAVTAGLSMTFSDGAGIEDLYGGAGDDTLTGNTRDNVIWGQEGDDALDGGTAGYDVLKEERAGDWQLSGGTLSLPSAGETNTFNAGTFDEI
ncbi:MAG: LEPR-XLL domain-containing protein, partial [Verrucomicrobia bacterium]|nr:LEPR-XLL domain-containing protein [Verrucomicrobiota bacterium]